MKLLGIGLLFCTVGLGVKAVDGQAQEEEFEVNTADLIYQARLIWMQGEPGETVWAGPNARLINPWSCEVAESVVIRKDLRVPIPALHRRADGSFALFFLSFKAQECGTKQVVRIGGDPVALVIPDDFSKVKDPKEVRIRQRVSGRPVREYDSSCLVAYTVRDSFSELPAPAGPIGEVETVLPHGELLLGSLKEPRVIEVGSPTLNPAVASRTTTRHGNLELAIYPPGGGGEGMPKVVTTIGGPPQAEISAGGRTGHEVTIVMGPGPNPFEVRADTDAFIGVTPRVYESIDPTNPDSPSVPSVVVGGEDGIPVHYPDPTRIATNSPLTVTSSTGALSLPPTGTAPGITTYGGDSGGTSDWVGIVGGVVAAGGFATLLTLDVPTKEPEADPKTPEKPAEPPVTTTISFVPRPVEKPKKADGGVKKPEGNPLQKLVTVTAALLTGLPANVPAGKIILPVVANSEPAQYAVRTGGRCSWRLRDEESGSEPKDIGEVGVSKLFVHLRTTYGTRGGLLDSSLTGYNPTWTEAIDEQHSLVSQKRRILLERMTRCSPTAPLTRNYARVRGWIRLGTHTSGGSYLLAQAGGSLNFRGSVSLKVETTPNPVNSKSYETGKMQGQVSVQWPPVQVQLGGQLNVTRGTGSYESYVPDEATSQSENLPGDLEDDNGPYVVIESNGNLAVKLRSGWTEASLCVADITTYLEFVELAVGCPECQASDARVVWGFNPIEEAKESKEKYGKGGIWDKRWKEARKRDRELTDKMSDAVKRK